MTLFFALASAVAATTMLRPAFIRPKPIVVQPRPWTLPLLDTSLFPLTPQPKPRCSEENFAQPPEVNFNSNTGKFILTVYFKNFEIGDSQAGTNSITCTLFTKLPGGYDTILESASLLKTVYVLESNVPNKTVDGKADFGVGILPTEGLALSSNSDNTFVEGSAPSTGDDSGNTSMAKRNANSDGRASDIKKIDNNPPKDSELIRTKSTTFGSQTGRGLAPDGKQIITVNFTDDAPTGYPTSLENVIVNQISLSITSTPNVDLEATVQLQKVEIHIQSNMM